MVIFSGVLFWNTHEDEMMIEVVVCWCEEFEYALVVVAVAEACPVKRKLTYHYPLSNSK